jgi:hypothetical protein
MPSRYLASVSMFVGKQKEHPFVEKVLLECFDSFFVHLVNKYTDARSYKVHTVGSIGFYFKDHFLKVAAKHGYEIGNVIQSPIEGLINYHLQVQ